MKKSWNFAKTSYYTAKASQNMRGDRTSNRCTANTGFKLNDSTKLDMLLENQKEQLVLLQQIDASTQKENAEIAEDVISQCISGL